MGQKTLILILVCAALAGAQPPAANMPAAGSAPAIQQPPDVSAPDINLAAKNLTDIKAKLVAFQKMGEYDREIAEVVQPAHDWIVTRVAITTPGEKMAAVFDLDETLLSNLPDMVACGFCDGAIGLQLYAGKPLPAIAPVQDLFNFAKSKGIAPIVVTGRSDARRDETTKQLTDAGYSGWQELHMRPAGETGPVAAWKTSQRAAVEKEGYTIILNIGDQLSDLAGGHSERTYKLPNPFYFVP
jgi:acid phosphatase